jgi:hypothetical protein
MKAELESQGAELVSEFALQVLPIGTLRPDQLFTFRAPPGFTAEPRAILPVEIIVPASVADFSGKSLRMSAAAVVWHRLVRPT